MAPRSCGLHRCKALYVSSGCFRTVIGPVRAMTVVWARTSCGATVVAGADTQCSLLGCGHGSNQVAIVAGTTSPIQMVMSRPVLDPLMKTWTSFHVVPNSWVLEIMQVDSFAAWLADIVGALSGVEATNEVYVARPFGSGVSPGAGDLRSLLSRLLWVSAGLGRLSEECVRPELREEQDYCITSCRALMENVAAFGKP